jgi:ATP-dependent DNA helicase RecQ
LTKFWGYRQFRPLQSEIISAVLNGRDTLALLPTGGGKSICYQIPTLCGEGICLVISPLIALMKDQVQQLIKRNIPAVALYSGQSPHEMDRLLDNCTYGAVKFLYISPERLLTERFLTRLLTLPVKLIAVDEAHCISQWGYDFRPSYLKIAGIREHFPNTPILALTASATEEVVQDIQVKLAFNRPEIFKASFSRENLALVVRNTEDKEKESLKILKKVSGSTIIYVRNRKKTQELATFLLQHKISAEFYHAGLNQDERSEKQDLWIHNKVRVMVTTNAFGMGIDKPDVRLVLHWELPDNPEAYYQEAGRAGRDGAKSFAVLLYQPNDKNNLQKLYALTYPDIQVIKKVYQALANYFQLAAGSAQAESNDFDIIHFCHTYKFDYLVSFNCISLLAREGWLYLSESVYIPASFKMLIGKEQLYDFQLKNQNFEPLIKVLLRTCQGAFQDFVYVHERKLGDFLRISPEQVKQQLQYLSKLSIISYRPQKDKPQLQFIRERAGIQEFYIDAERYSFLKKRAKLRLQTLFDYVDARQCRMKNLVAYFGEELSEPCGRCDFCLSKKEFSADIKNQLTRLDEIIQNGLKEKPVDIPTLIEPFHGVVREALLKHLHLLLDQGIICEKKGLLFLKK